MNVNHTLTLSKSKVYDRFVGWSGENMDSRPFGPKEIDGLLVPPCKAYTLLTDHLITG